MSFCCFPKFNPIGQYVDLSHDEQRKVTRPQILSNPIFLLQIKASFLEEILGTKDCTTNISDILLLLLRLQVSLFSSSAQKCSNSLPYSTPEKTRAWDRFSFQIAQA
jgi:hypothetical protein